ncbi:MAG: Trk system potassium transporter TrkA [Kiritimatiellia bacterium]|nr:Trk system potassium transporter TrkA [Kiritimatiellia bacterium]
MRILIVGAGNTGRNLATKLCQMHHDIVVVDPNQTRLDKLEGEADLLTICGSGCSPAILAKAEISKADLMIAVSNRDEINILACQIAHAAKVKHKVARISDTSLSRTDWLDWQQLGVDLMISHKEETANEIAQIVQNPGALEIIELLDGRIKVVGIRVDERSRLLGGTLMDIHEADLFGRLRFIAVMRNEELLVPRGDTRFMVGDDIYVALRPADLPAMLAWAYPQKPSYGKVVIAGGGDMGMELARNLDASSLSTTLLEQDSARADFCASELNKVLVLNGDASDQETLANAGIGHDTAFIAITGDEELNIVSCILANKLGAGFTLAQVTKPEYVPIIKTLSLLDRVVSPHLSMINAILHFVRGRNVKSAALLHKLPGELLQIDVPAKHRWIGRSIRDIKAPKGALIVTALRDGKIHVPTGEYQISASDQLVIFCKPETVERIEKAFHR